MVTMADTTVKPVMGGMFRIPKALLESWEIDQIRQEMTYNPKSDSKYGFGGRPVATITYNEDADWLEVPRAYGQTAMRRFSGLKTLDYVDRTCPGEKVEFDFNHEMQASRPSRKAIQDRLVGEVIRKFRSGTTGGVLHAPCGTGKTVMGLKVAYEMGLTTLVLVYKDFLVDQWRERITQWLKIPAEEIGVVQQNRCDYQGRRIVIAMIQSVVEREYDPELWNWAGLVIADEVHRHGADLWHKASIRFNSKYRLGLTATPDRKDGMWSIVINNFGPILASDSGEAMKPTIYTVFYKPEINVGEYCWVAGTRMGVPRIKKVYLGKFLTALAREPKRNQMLVDIMLKAAREDRKVLLLTDRREHITMLKEMILEQSNGEITVGRYVGGMSESARSLSEQCQIILGTFQMAQEALDIPALDVGIFATPHSDVEQSAGRVCRQMDGKKEPIIVDVVDVEQNIGMPFFRKRNALYAKRGWQVKRI